MAKTSFPVNAGSGLLGKLVSAVIVLAVLWLVIQHPAEAASWVSGAFAFAGKAVNGIASFFQNLG